MVSRWKECGKKTCCNAQQLAVVEEARGCFSRGPWGQSGAGCGQGAGHRAGQRCSEPRRQGQHAHSCSFPPPATATPKGRQVIFLRQEQTLLSPKCKSCLGAGEGGAPKDLLFFFLPTLEGQVCIHQPILCGTEEWHSAGQPGKLASSAQPNYPISAGNLLQHRCATPDSARAPACRGGLLSLYTHFRTNLC